MVVVAASKYFLQTITPEAIALIASGTDIYKVQYQQEFKLVQKHSTQVLASFLLFGEEIPADVCSLLSQLRDLVITPFDQTIPIFLHH